MNLNLRFGSGPHRIRRVGIPYLHTTSKHVHQCLPLQVLWVRRAGDLVKLATFDLSAVRILSLFNLPRLVITGGSWLKYVIELSSHVM